MAWWVVWRSMMHRAGILGGLVLIVLWAEHRPALRWMQGYTNAYGMPCCSEVDCREAQVSLLDSDGDQTSVLVNGVPLVLPSRSVHLSQDNHSYQCGGIGQPPTSARVRCVFYTYGM